MKRLSYPKAIDAVLAARGFIKDKNQWIRQEGEFVDNIDLQLGMFFDKVAVNLRLRHEGINAVLSAADPPGWVLGLLYPVNERLGTLMTGYDRWWVRSDPDGPRQAAEAVEKHALPFLEGLHSLEALKTYLDEGPAIKWRDPTSREYVAVLLAMMGRTEEALEKLADPPRRLHPPSLAKIENLRRMIREGLPMAVEAKP